MSNVTINQRIISSINYLLEHNIVSKKGDIADTLGCSPQTITEILGGRQGMKIDLLQKFFERFQVSYQYIFEGKGEILKEKNTPINTQLLSENTLKSGKTNSSENNVQENVQVNVPIPPLFLPESGKTKGANIIELPIVKSDNSDMVGVPVVDISVAAGHGFENPDYLSEVDTIYFPKSMMHNGKNYLCVRIKGESMEPTLQDGGYLVIRLLDRSEWASIREGYVYVVSDIEGRAYVKRLKNRLSEHGFIVCTSDNPDVTRYRNFHLFENEINTVWYAEWYVSAKMPNIHTHYYNKVNELEDKYDDIITQMQQIQREIRALSQHN